MKHLAILITAPDDGAVQEALDDAAATIAAGAPSGWCCDGETRVQFARADSGAASEYVVGAMAELLRVAWDCGLDIGEVSENAWRLLLRKIPDGQA